MIKKIKVFRSTSIIGTLRETLIFIFQLVCAWMLSDLLKVAIEANREGLCFKIVVTGTVILMCGIIRGVLYYAYERTYEDGLQSYREWFCRGVIKGKFSVSTSGELDTRLQGDGETIASFYGEKRAKMIAAIISGVFCAVILSTYNLLLVLIMVGISLLQLLPVLIYEKWAKAIYMQTMQDDENYINWVVEGLNGISTIKSYQQETWFIQRFRKYNQTVVQSGLKETKTAAVEDIITEFVSTILNYGVYIVLGLFIIWQKVSMIDTPMLLILAQNMFLSSATVVKGFISYFRSQSAIKRLGKEIEDNEENEPTDENIIIRVKGIQKGYEGRRILEDISFDIKRGEKILLQGVNGGGKTTLLRILAGVVKPDAGEVQKKKNETTVVFQEEPEIELRGHEIVNYLKENKIISGKTVREHFLSFHIDDILNGSPEEYSIGQKKKFYLAIAMARKTELLILDEPTNHLDMESVEYFITWLHNYKGTIVICSHDTRLDLMWDKRMHIEGGRLYED